jgi:hypothetical protein
MYFKPSDVAGSPRKFYTILVAFNNHGNKITAKRKHMPMAWGSANETPLTPEQMRANGWLLTPTTLPYKKSPWHTWDNVV